MTDKQKPHLHAVPDAEPAPAPGESAEDFTAALAAMLLEELPDARATHAPHFPVERLEGTATFLAQEQGMIDEDILPRMAPEADAHSHIVLRFAAMPGPGEDPNAPRPGAQIAARRTLAGVTDPGMAAQTAFVLAFLQGPLARGVLRMNGFAYQFSFANLDDQPEQKPLVTL